MVNLPNFDKRRRMLEPIEFVPVQYVFTPMVEIRMLKDVSGWVQKKEDRKKWSMPTGSIQTIDETKASEFVAKGFAEYVHPGGRVLSEDEVAELQAQVTTIRMGGSK